MCAGPNIAYYKKIVSLKEMINHIYGRTNLIDDSNRPSLFVAELNMYVKYLKNEIKNLSSALSNIEIKRLSKFAKNLFDGIEYYLELTSKMVNEPDSYKEKIIKDIESAKNALDTLVSENKQVFQHLTFVHSS